MEITSTTKESVSRLKGLDAARGLAATCVVLAHSLEISNELLFNQVCRFVMPGIGGVFLFFLISGYVISFSLERVSSVKDFIVSRCFRIYPLFLTSLVLVYIMFQTGVLVWKSSIPINLAALINISMVQDFFKVPHLMQLYWSLGFEVIFYVVTGVCLVLGRVEKAKNIVVYISVLLLILAGISLVKGRAIGGDRLTPFTLMFLGVAFCAFRRGDLSKTAITSFSVLGICAITCQYLVSMHYNPGSLVGVSQIQTTFLAFVLFVIALFVPDRVVPSALVWLGRISFSLYLMHGLVLRLYQWSPLQLGFPLTFLLIYSVSILVSWATYEWIEKPGIRYGKSLIKTLKKA